MSGFDDPAVLALLGFGGNMLQASGQPGMGFGQAMGAGIQGGLQGLQAGKRMQQQTRELEMMEAYKKIQQQKLEAELEDNKYQRNQAEKFYAQYGGGAQGGAPGFNVQPPQGGMGPNTYDGRTQGLESRGGQMIFNELGSGAFGPYQFMPATWADVRRKNPDLNLPEDMTKASREQHDSAHGRFKAGNAEALQNAGFQPTPDNLYLAHRFGAGGAVSVLKADPNAPLATVLPIEWQKQNPDMRGQTAGGFRRLAAERYQGIGQPYQANGESTQYAMQPTALPAFAGTGMPAVQPGALPPGMPPQMRMPTMPQPQYANMPGAGGPVIPGMPIGDQPQADGSGTPLPPPQQRPPQQALNVPGRPGPRIDPVQAAFLSGNKYIGPVVKALTEQGNHQDTIYQQDRRFGFDQNQAAEAKRRWEAEQRAAREREAEAARRWKYEQENKGQFVRGADGVEKWVPETSLPNTTRHDKPPEPGTETGDYRLLTTADPASREYKAAYNRLKGKPIDVGGGQKMTPDMSAFAAPTFQEPNAGPAPVTMGNKTYTESQGKDYTYAQRLANSIPQLEKLVKGDDGKYSTTRLPSSYERAKGNSPYVPDSMISAEGKEFRRLAKDIVSGILRRESGASIPANEYEPEYQKYIPLPGDSDAEIRAKLRALKIAAGSIAEGSGRPLDSFGDAFKHTDEEPKAPPIRIDSSGRRK